MSTITITEPRVVRITEQTASRDHNAVLLPGTYDLKVKYQSVPFGQTPTVIDYVHASIPARTQQRRESSVEFGGVALATRVVEAQIEQYTLMIRGYEIDGWTLDQINL